MRDRAGDSRLRASLNRDVDRARKSAAADVAGGSFGLGRIEVGNS